LIIVYLKSFFFDSLLIKKTSLLSALLVLHFNDILSRLQNSPSLRQLLLSPGIGLGNTFSPWVKMNFANRSKLFFWYYQVLQITSWQRGQKNVVLYHVSLRLFKMANLVVKILMLLIRLVCYPNCNSHLVHF
jgi:hypothetical protein